jgi:hypothetical protein
MKRYFLFGLLILTFIASANAQKLVSGGKPKLFESKGGIEAYEVKFPGGIIVRKLGRQNDDDESGTFSISKNNDELGTIPASVNMASTIDNFYAYYGDLDKNNSAELVVVDFDGQSNGMGISFYTINIFPDFQTKGFQKPISFGTQEFGANGTFVYDAKANETLILITDFNGLENISQKEGTYFVGRFFRYQNGLLKPATDKPIYARRYLYSFENERYRTEKNPLRPWLWLNSPKAQKIKVDTEFSVKPVTNETGVVEKVETVTENAKELDETKKVEIKQITVKLNSGEIKTIVFRKNPDYIELDSDKGKIFPEIFGIAPNNLSLPKDLDLSLVLGNLEGRKVVINSYKPFEFDEEKKPRYKVLFYN